VREELRAPTGLHGKRLDALAGELETKISEIGHVAAMRLLERPAEAAQQYAEMAYALRALIKTQKQVHPAVRDDIGLPESALTRRFKFAEDMAARLRKRVTKGRSAVGGRYRDGLARASARTINEYCPRISRRRLRSAIAVVLSRAGYSFPEPEKNGDKFDRMFWPRSPNDEVAEREAKNLRSE
jgi:hypothetical protein